VEQDRAFLRHNLTRRELLAAAGAPQALGVLGWGPNSPQEPSAPGISAANSITNDLSTYMSEAANRKLPAEVEEKAKQHILDTIAAMVSGADLPPAKLAIKFARSYDGERVATVVGTDMLCGPVEAALINGTLAHSDETDDSHAPSQSHPGCGIVAAALAAGEKFATDGSRFVRAIALGFDVGTRVAMTLGGEDYQTSTSRDPHSIANTFGASAAAGCAASLNAQQMRWILDYAAQQASGIAAWQRDLQHVEKSLVFGGFPARNGVTAALLIQLGATGVEDIFFGSDNFFAAFGPKADPAGLIDKLGERYEIARTNIKKWTVGSPIQAPLDALQTIMKEHSFKPDQVDKVVVRMAVSEAKTVNNRDMPDICLQYLMAVMLIDGTVSFAAAHNKSRMSDQEIRALRSRVELVSDEELEKLYPKLVAVIDVTLKDGSKFSQRVDAVRGTVANPMNEEEVASKARDLMIPFLGIERTERLIQGVLGVEQITNIRQLSPLFSSD
jgi:2-methylcitrate dehydratase PrpD